MSADAPISDRLDSEPEVNKDWDIARSMGSLRASLGIEDPDDDGHKWYSVFGDYDG